MSLGGFQIRAVFGPRSRRFALSGSSLALAAKPATGANVAATRAKGKAASAWLNRFQIRRGLLRFGQVVCGDLHRVVVLPEPDHDLTVCHRVQRLERFLPDLCQAGTFLHRRDPEGFEI